MKKIVVFLAIVILASFQKGDKNQKEFRKVIEKNFALVSSGDVLLEGKTTSIQSFYISKGEITNAQYRLFINDLRLNNKLKELLIALPDTNSWVKSIKFGDKFKEHYFSHPAYDQYPVVNVSYEGANMYCEWFTGKMKKELGSDQFTNFRLPTKEEFIRACRGENHYQQYSWNGSELQTKEGNYLCNFARLGAENIHFNPLTKAYEVKFSNEISYSKSNENKETSDIIAPTKSYWGNAFGIYNLNGNVAELIDEKGKAIGGGWRSTGYDVRNESMLSYSAPLPYVGFRIVMTCKAK